MNSIAMAEIGFDPMTVWRLDYESVSDPALAALAIICFVML
jgi:hypothetical protein